MTPGTLSAYLLEKKAKGEKALVSYLVAGYPTVKNFQKHLSSVLEASDLVEIGFPFSDPLADGTTIQRAFQRVLEQGLEFDTFCRFLAPVVSRSRKPLMLMSYLNPVLQHGLEKAASRLAKLNFRGILFPDLPLEEGESVRKVMNRYAIEIVYLLSPATSLERAQRILRRSQAFVYLVSLKGVTGARSQIPTETLEYLQRIRPLCSKPLYLGFGISHPLQVAQLSPWVDGVIVGSALLERLEESGQGTKKAGLFLKGLKETLNPAKKESRP